MLVQCIAPKVHTKYFRHSDRAVDHHWLTDEYPYTNRTYKDDLRNNWQSCFEHVVASLNVQIPNDCLTIFVSNTGKTRNNLDIIHDWCQVGGRMISKPQLLLSPAPTLEL